MPIYDRLLSLREIARKVLNYWAAGDGMYGYPDHSYEHSDRIYSKLQELLYKSGLSMNDEERFLLYASAYLHDMGNLCCRRIHNRESRAFVIGDWGRNYLKDLSGPWDDCERNIVGQLCYAHREVAMDTVPLTDNCQGNTIKLRLLAALLRLADACDLDSRRGPPEAYDIFVECGLSVASKLFWEAHQNILNVLFDQVDRCIYIEVSDEGKAQTAVDELVEDFESVKDVLDYYNLPFDRVVVRKVGLP